MGDANRQLRERLASLDGLVDRRIASSRGSTPKRLVQVYNGGAMGAAPMLFYLTNPVELDGTESEGGSSTPTADTTQTIPVVFLDNAPSVGDIVPAFRVGGRWVAERGTSPTSSSYACSPCAIPKQDLTISWVNPLAGNGSDTLVYNATGPSWATGCSGGAGIGNQLIFKLFCTGGQIELRVYYFVSGSCPTGQSSYCSNLRSSPSQLVLASYVCGSGFTLNFTLTSATCPTVAGSGFTNFAVTL